LIFRRLRFIPESPARARGSLVLPGVVAAPGLSLARPQKRFN
jgi:hypothetical protein